MLHTTIHCRRCLFSLQTTGVSRWQFHVLNMSLFRYQTQYGYRFTAFITMCVYYLFWSLCELSYSRHWDRSISNIYWMKIYTYWIVPKYEFPRPFQPDITSTFTLEEIKCSDMYLKLRSLLIHCDLISKLDTEFG